MVLLSQPRSEGPCNSTQRIIDFGLQRYTYHRKLRFIARLSLPASSAVATIKILLYLRHPATIVCHGPRREHTPRGTKYRNRTRLILWRVRGCDAAIVYYTDRTRGGGPKVAEWAHRKARFIGNRV